MTWPSHSGTWQLGNYGDLHKIKPGSTSTPIGSTSWTQWVSKEKGEDVRQGRGHVADPRGIPEEWGGGSWE